MNQRGSAVEAILFFIILSLVSSAGLYAAHYFFRFDWLGFVFLIVVGLFILTLICIALYFRYIGKQADAWQNHKKNKSD